MGPVDPSEVEVGLLDGDREVDLSGWFVSDDDLTGLIARLLPTNGPVALNRYAGDGTGGTKSVMRALQSIWGGSRSHSA